MKARPIKNLQLQKEVVQFEIKFHHDDVVDVSSHMYVHYVDETITSVYCLLTDGEKPLFEPPGCTFFVPERKYYIITPRIRFSIGKYWLIEFLNNREGKQGIGAPWNDSGYFNVQAGDSWYLTLAVPASAEKIGFSVDFTSINDSMEVHQLARHNHVGLYAAKYNQFSGRYYAIKLSLLGGFSLCDVFKEITTKDGSIVDIYAAAHRKGTMKVSLPNGETKQFSNKGIIHYHFLGNESGTWRFSVKGWSLYHRMGVFLLYIDIDPHVKAS